MSADFWRNKRVLLTGHTGFKGGWLAIRLERLGAKVTGISLAPSTSPSLFNLANIEHICASHIQDIRDQKAIAQLVKLARPEIVFHLAAQPLVRASYQDPLGTYCTNVMGTANLLDALRFVDSCKVAVLATTDKVYKNNEWLYPYREDDALGGHDPYSASKAACEIIICSYRDAFLKDRGVAIASARAGNVIGGGDWSPDRLFPDALRAWQSADKLEIRHPEAIRPWQHVLEPLHGYLTLAQKLWHKPALADAYNFGPCTHEAASVRDVVQLARQFYGKGDVHFDESVHGPHEASYLALETAKARQILNVSSRWSLSESVANTMSWYRDQHAGADARSLCIAQIAAYEADI
jgi:CDP-glucose 4,6-dehydratase